MLPGFNTNVRHGGVLFHVQTEDSGKSHPHVITHLYHGGTILASEKSSYAEHVDAPDLSTRVRELLDAQHHAMLKRLGTGDLDEQIEQRLGSGVFARDEKSKTASNSASNTAHGSTAPEPTLRPARLTEPPLTEPASPATTSPGAAAPPDRPLDELILDYLVEAARRRKRRTE
jgi:hypothetical protein